MKKEYCCIVYFLIAAALSVFAGYILYRAKDTALSTALYDLAMCNQLLDEERSQRTERANQADNLGKKLEAVSPADEQTVISIYKEYLDECKAALEKERIAAKTVAETCGDISADLSVCTAEIRFSEERSAWKYIMILLFSVFYCCCCPNLNSLMMIHQQHRIRLLYH